MTVKGESNRKLNRSTAKGIILNMIEGLSDRTTHGIIVLGGYVNIIREGEIIY